MGLQRGRMAELFRVMELLWVSITMLLAHRLYSTKREFYCRQTKNTFKSLRNKKKMLGSQKPMDVSYRVSLLS